MLRLAYHTSLSKYVINDPKVSSRHLRIYTVVYDNENPSDVAPLVYAHDISRNGTWWNGHPMSKTNDGVVLLSNGDTLQIGSGFILEFRCPPSQEVGSFTRLQREEMKVV
jgi:protein-serine/threonine kinase